MIIQLTATYKNTTIASNFYTCDFITALNHITKIARDWMNNKFWFSDQWEGKNERNAQITITLSSFNR